MTRTAGRADRADDRPRTADAPARRPHPSGDEGATSRINLRLPDHLKAASRRPPAEEGLSVNAWLVRAAAAALRAGPRAAPQRGEQTGSSLTGWVR